MSAVSSAVAKGKVTGETGVGECIFTVLVLDEVFLEAGLRSLGVSGVTGV